MSEPKPPLALAWCNAADPFHVLDEIALYDRQIRLWGFSAQKRIQQSSVLLITCRALTNEVAKNLVLAGVGSVTLVDAAPLTDADLGAQCMVTSAAVAAGKTRAAALAEALRRLNPRVRVVDGTDDSAVVVSPAFLGAFDLVVATDLSSSGFSAVSRSARAARVPLYCAGVHGLHGFAFADLGGTRDFTTRRAKGNVATVPGAREGPTRRVVGVQAVKGDRPGEVLEVVTRREAFSGWADAAERGVLPRDVRNNRRRIAKVGQALPCLRGLWSWQAERLAAEGGGYTATSTTSSNLLAAPPIPSPSSHADLISFTLHATAAASSLSLPSDALRAEFLARFLAGCGSELSAVAAVVGGQVAQEAIALLGGGTQTPLQNLAVLDGGAMESVVYTLHPEDGPVGWKDVPGGEPKGLQVEEEGRVEVAAIKTNGSGGMTGKKGGKVDTNGHGLTAESAVVLLD